MANDLERFRRLLNETWRVSSNTQWLQKRYSVESAYVMAIFAKMAYLVITEYELKRHSGVKVIPCLTYQRLLAERRKIDVKSYLRGNDFLDVFVLISPWAVAVGIVRSDLIVVALRGTRLLYLSDWMIDVRATKRSIGSQGVKLHTGFLEATRAFIDQLSKKIQDRREKFTPRPPVYLAGHSLGGALVGVVQVLAGLGRSADSGQRSNTARSSFEIHAGFTFGMPRYGNEGICSPSAPYHTLNLHDLVPSLPPKWLGFADVSEEWLLFNARTTPEKSRGARGIQMSVSRARAVRHHFIERYIMRLGKLVDRKVVLP